MQPVALEGYLELMTLHEKDIKVESTGLHVHAAYPFIAGSPDGVVSDGGDTGLIEIKYPASKQGMTPTEACRDKNFFCQI